MGESFGAVIGCADGAHLPLLHQLRVSLQRFIQRSVRIVTMRLIKIDVVRLQPSQRIFRRAQNVSLGKTFPVRSHLQPNFGGDDDLIASATLLEPLADDSFRFTTMIARRESGINVSSVDEIESGGNESIEQSEGRSLVHRPAEHVPAERERRYFQA